MFLNTVYFIVFLTVFKIHFSKPNDATSAVSFERLEMQIKKDSKYIIVILYYSSIYNLRYLCFIRILVYWYNVLNK